MKAYAWVVNRAVRIAAAGCALVWLAGTAGAITSSWILDADGSWTNTANWNNGAPTNAGDVAYFTNTLTATRTVTIDTGITVGTLRVGTVGNAIKLTGGSGTVTMDSGSAARAVLQQTGSLQNYGPTKIFMACDLEIDDNGTTYMNLTGSTISGAHDIYINGNGAGNTPYLGGTSSYTGNTYICSGTLMCGSDVFGATSAGTRVITITNNANYRLNISGPSLAANRMVVIGTGGAKLNTNGQTLTLNSNGQLIGTNTLTIYNSTATGGGMSLGGTNDDFAGQVVMDSAAILRLNANGCINSAPVINMIHVADVLNVTNKPAGYTIPAGQVVAGIGTNLGVFKVASASATLHPGVYALPGPVSSPGVMTVSGGLTFTNGGVYAWDLKQLKDDATASPGTTTFATINVVTGPVNLAGGTLAINFNGVSAPSPTNTFWKSPHTWTVLSSATTPVGTLTVTNTAFGSWAFRTQMVTNTLQLVYVQVPVGTAVLVQ